MQDVFVDTSDAVGKLNELGGLGDVRGMWEGTMSR